MSPSVAHPCRIVEKVGELPTLPAIYSRIAELTSNPETGAADLERVIEKDQALAGKLLKLVNSAFYGFPVEIRTISRAVMIVGFQALSQLALSTSVLTLWSGAADAIARMDEVDVFLVGGGNTLNMLALWSAHGLGQRFRSYAQDSSRDVVLAGVSAGGAVWHD